PMFSDLASYCGWLAKDGERLCNPMSVRQAFMQYCQAFAVRLNYCVQQVSTARCGTSGCGYYYKGTWERYSSYSDRARDKGKANWSTSKPTQPDVPSKPDDTVLPPVIVTPDCVNPDLDCKRKNLKKAELICKLPRDAAKEENYV